MSVIITTDTMFNPRANSQPMIHRFPGALFYKRLLLALCLLLGVVAAGWTFRPFNSHAGLVLYSSMGYAPEVVDAFIHQTGIPVTLVDMSTGPLLARVSAEGHRPAWSLVWFDGDAAAVALDRSGLLARQTVPPLPFTQLGGALVPADGAYTPTGVTLAGVFSVRTHDASLPPGLGWNSLTLPAETGQFSMGDPELSGPAYFILASMLEQHGGWPQGQVYVTALQQNGLRMNPTNSGVELALQTHQVNISIVQSSAAFALARNPAYRVVIPGRSAVLPSVIASAAGLPPDKAKDAEAFIRFVMTPEVQQLRMRAHTADSFFWPVTSDAPVPALPPLSGIPVIMLDPASWGRHEAEIGAWFTGMTQRQ